MSFNRLAKYETLINEHLNFQEELYACYLKAWGALQILLDRNLVTTSKTALYGILLGISDNLSAAKRLSEQRLDEMLDIRAALLKQRPLSSQEDTADS